MFTTIGRSEVALLIGGGTGYPAYCAIGSGSGAVAASNGSLVAEVLASRVQYTSRDTTTTRKVAYTFDFGSVTMSGTNLREFGVGVSSTKGTTDLWSREGFPAITFDGTNELQIEVTFEVF